MGSTGLTPKDSLLKTGGERLKRLRDIIQISQTDLADVLDVHALMVCRWEKNHFGINQVSMEKLALYLGRDRMFYLLTGKIDGKRQHRSARIRSKLKKTTRS